MGAAVVRIGLAIALIVAMLVVLGRRADHQTTSEPVNLSQIRRDVQRLKADEDWHAVVEILDAVPEGSFAKPRALLEQGRAFWEISDGPRMEATLARCIALEPDPENPSDITLSALSTLGDHYLGQERFDEAKRVIFQVYDAGARRGRPDPFYLTLLLRTRFETADPAVANERLDQFLATDPEDADARRAKGIYLSRMHQVEEAREHLHAALQAKPRAPRFWNAWLNFLLLIGDHDQAAEAVAELPPECDGFADFWVYRAKLATYQDDWSAATKALERALEIEPGRLDAANLYSQALRKTGREVEADEATARFRKSASAYTDAVNRFSELNLRKGRPVDSQVCQDLSEICRTLGWEREAKAWAEVAQFQSLQESGAGR